MRFVLKNQANYAHYAITHLVLKLLENTKFTENKGQKMKYKIQNIIVLEELDGVEVRDIVYQELTEQEFLVKYLQNPDLIYWAIHDDGSRDYYRNNKHVATVDQFGNATNIIDKSGLMKR